MSDEMAIGPSEPVTEQVEQWDFTFAANVVYSFDVYLERGQSGEEFNDSVILTFGADKSLKIFLHNILFFGKRLIAKPIPEWQSLPPNAPLAPPLPKKAPLLRPTKV